MRTRKSKILVQDKRYLLLGNTAINAVIGAEKGTFGFLFKLTHISKSDKDEIVKNMSAHFVGSEVGDLHCFL